MKTTRLIATLNSIGSLLDGLIAELEDDEPAAGSGECEHPHDERDDLTTMGGPEGWRCRACGFSTLSKNETQTDDTHTEELGNVSNSR
jgi:hypothetical protein